MTTDAQAAPAIARRLTLRRLVTTGVVMLVGYWAIARGSIVGGIGGVAGEGTWIDGRGQPTTEAPLTYAIDLGPSPFVMLVVVAALVLAWTTSEVRGRLAWLAPACEVAAIVVPIAAVVATFAWIHGFDRTGADEVSIVAPWWSSTSVTIDHMR